MTTSPRSRSLPARLSILAAFAALGFSTAGCPQTLGLLSALQSPIVEHQERWFAPGTGVGTNRPEPGECVSDRPAIVWGERSNPASTPPDPIDVVDLKLEVTTPDVCELILLDDGHAFRLRGKAEGNCTVASSYTHPVKNERIDETFTVEFAKEPPPPPPTIAFERPKIFSCDSPVTSDPPGVTRPKAATSAR